MSFFSSLRFLNFNWVILCVLAITAGCSGGPTALKPPDIDAAAAAKQAIVLYDTDGDSLLAPAETAKSPALAHAARQIDMNGDQKISADEVAARIRSWSARGTAIKEFRCRVTLNGQPLPGVEVVLEPERFLAESVQPARGETDAQGIAVISVPRESLPNPSISGVTVGLYTVRISSRTNERLVPARYNRSSELGQEVADDPASIDDGSVEYRLKTS
jgi:hypothetical protein